MKPGKIIGSITVGTLVMIIAAFNNAPQWAASLGGILAYLICLGPISEK